MFETTGVAGYLTSKGGDFGPQARNGSRFALFVALWTLVFGTLIGVGTFLRTKFVNTGFVHFVYLFITLVFWIAVGVS